MESSDITNTYRAVAPAEAEAVVTERWPEGGTRRVQYLLEGEVVAERLVAESDPRTFIEWGVKDGKKHGPEVRYDDGELVSMEPWEEGLPHGVARQWHAGEVIGEYSLVHGTGLDLWRGLREDGSIYLAEVFHLKQGRLHGFEWWIGEDQRSVFEERHWQEGQLHGIERAWNERGRLRRGYPRYHVRGERVDKRRYLRACRDDPALQRFDAADNAPERTFPDEIQGFLTRG
jgi:hypothetical protein